MTSYGQITVTGLRHLIAPLMARQIRKAETAELATLKRLAETPQP